jgi:hypothetical protein
VYLLVFHAYINEIQVQEVNSPVKNLVHIYIYIVCVCVCVKLLALLGAPCVYIYEISRLRVKVNLISSYT